MTEETMTVYKGPGVLHLPGEDGETACHLPTGAFEREERPIRWAGVWCTDCMTAALRGRA